MPYNKKYELQYDFSFHYIDIRIFKLNHRYYIRHSFKIKLNRF